MSSKILVLDPLKCTGCRLCELACSYDFGKVFNPTLSRIRVVPWFEKGISIPVFCQQCDVAPCVEVCPTGALYRDAELGAVMWDRDKCIGCKACVSACPFGAIFYDPRERVIMKCDLCKGEPLCVKFCPTGALSYEEHTKIADARRRDAAKKLYEYMTKIVTVPSG